jgi:hypothetical protein
MKNIKEKENLIKMSLALGVEPDAKLVREVAEYRELMKSVKSASEEFSQLLSDLSKLKVESAKPIKPIELPKPPTVEELLESFTEEIKPIKSLEIPKPPTLEELMEQVGIDEEEAEQIENKANTLIELAAEHIKKEVQFEDKSYLNEEEAPVSQTIVELRNKIKYLEQWVSRIASTGPGSGEVNLLRLDDVDTANIANERYLRYNSNTTKIEFATVDTGDDLSNVSSNIIPTLDSTFNLGSADKRFKTLFLANNTIDLGGSLIQSDGTGQISISGTGAVLPSGSRIDVGQRQERIALVGDTGSLISVVPFFTQQLGLNTIAANFEFGANPDDFVFTNFTLSNGTGLQQAGIAQFYF